jgi:hypothetical protein
MIFAEDPLAALEDSWRERLTEGQKRYSENRNGETRQEYLLILRIFTDLVSRLTRPLEM